MGNAAVALIGCRLLVFFSNRIGCLGSLAVSAILTLILIKACSG
jgi:energy-converting hydrogenase Eha subunit E